MLGLWSWVSTEQNVFLPWLRKEAKVISTWNTLILLLTVVYVVSILIGGFPAMFRTSLLGNFALFTIGEPCGVSLSSMSGRRVALVGDFPYCSYYVGKSKNSMCPCPRSSA